MKLEQQLKLHGELVRKMVIIQEEILPPGKLTSKLFGDEVFLG